VKLKSIALVALVAAILPAASSAETYLGFTIGVSNAPPAPKVVFASAPTVVVVPSTTVYVVSDKSCSDDVFRYGSTWYIYRSGYWYRSGSHAGPWIVVDVRKVPRAVIDVPQSHWKRHPHGGPPGQTKKASAPGNGKGNSSKGHKG
jgi:hypothetical protein